MIHFARTFVKNTVTPVDVQGVDECRECVGYCSRILPAVKPSELCLIAVDIVVRRTMRIHDEEVLKNKFEYIVWVIQLSNCALAPVGAKYE